MCSTTDWTWRGGVHFHASFHRTMDRKGSYEPPEPNDSSEGVTRPSALPEWLREREVSRQATIYGLAWIARSVHRGTS